MPNSEVSSMTRILYLPLFLVLALLVVSCAPTKEATESGPVKIGFVGPLTGVAANYGQNALIAAQLAVEEVNAAGGVNGREIQLVSEDDKCEGKSAATAVNKLISVDDVPVVIGSLCSAATLAFTDIAEQNQRIVIAYGASSPLITDAGDFIFRDFPSDAAQGVFAAQHLWDKGYKTVAIVSCLDDYCQGLSDVFQSTFESLGGTVVARDSFEKGASDFRTQLAKAQNAKPDVLYAIAFTDDAISLLRQKEEMGFDAPVFSSELFGDPAIPEALGSAVDGVQFSVPFTPENKEFLTKMEERLNGKDLTVGEQNAYDAVKIVAMLMNQGATTPEQLRDALYAMPPYEGTSGVVAFDENGDLKNPAYSIKEYKDGGIVLVQ